jgi:tRNA (guanine37-N1)-methyltransferase
MKLAVVCLFPELFQPFLSIGMVGRAVKQGKLAVELVNPRDFAEDVHRTVDDRPYGGGPGMVMLAEPIRRAIAEAKVRLINAGVVTAPKVIYLSPAGKKLDQAGVKALIATPGIVFLAGRYEGIDQRIIDQDVDSLLSVGDYVLSGGELAAQICIDTMARLLPGVLGHPESAEQDAFSSGLGGILDCPHYTRPAVLGNQVVPEVLLSGDHVRIACWRRKQALGQTWMQRPDLLAQLQHDKESQLLLNEFINER